MWLGNGLEVRNWIYGLFLSCFVYYVVNFWNGVCGDKLWGVSRVVYGKIRRWYVVVCCNVWEFGKKGKIVVIVGVGFVGVLLVLLLVW